MRAAAALVLLFSLGGCREGAGSHCTQTSDCTSGLACILPVGGTPQTGGICSTLDASVELDFAMPGDDGGKDGGLDSSTVDSAIASFDAGGDLLQTDL